jgi:hypothetical protein
MNARVEELFHELADLSPKAREQYFDEHRVDAETRREVEALLAFDAGASALIGHDISLAARRSWRSSRPFRSRILRDAGADPTVCWS